MSTNRFLSVFEVVKRIRIPACNGRKTLESLRTSNRNGFESPLKDLKLNRRSIATTSVNVSVYWIPDSKVRGHDGSMSRILLCETLGSLTKNRKKLCLTPHQVVQLRSKLLPNGIQDDTFCFIEAEGHLFLAQFGMWKGRHSHFKVKAISRRDDLEFSREDLLILPELYM